ncbi:MAG: HDOD domain-containing protein [Magnetococcales bacterium]|nr:HDOD domain-containing protein [Magnetococcales bacterium]
MATTEPDLFSLMESITAFPLSGYRILQLANDLDCPPRTWVRVIEQDPILTLHLIRLVNTDHFGLTRKILSVKQAVVFLGVNTVKNLALEIAPMELIAGADPATGPLTLVHRHSLTTAIIAKKLARGLGFSERDATDCHVAGLLHDFGKIALHRLFPERYTALLRRKDREDLEEEQFVALEWQEFATTHTLVGDTLARKWQLPELIVHSMGGHHEADRCAGNPLLACVYAANMIAQTMDRDHSGRPSRKVVLPATMVALFNKDLEGLSTELGLFADEIDHAMRLTTVWENGFMTPFENHS